MRRWTVVVALVLAAAAPLIGAVGNAAAQEAAARRDVIVVLPVRLSVRQVVRDLGIAPTFEYGNVFEGFAATVSGTVYRRLQGIPGVVVTEDRRVEESQRRRRRPPITQRTPTGVNRIDADRNAQVDIDRAGGAIDADVAVLDTGIAAHPDLYVYRGYSCVGGDPRAYGDRDGHGTHVAGTIGARDNRAGVVGVAPAARLWAVKVLNDNGSGSYASIICGLDHVVANSAAIDVANMSLGGFDPNADTSTCADDAFHRAVCETVAAGVTVVVAAGNERDDAANYAPAAYDEAITVSSFTDYNGVPGGGATRTCYSDQDDSFSSFSNFGADVDVVAPGGCIRSTAPGRRYAVLSGTSMATPHVAGAAALYVAANPGDETPAQVRAYLLGDASRPQLDPEVGLEVDDDPDAIPEPILYVGPPLTGPPSPASPA